MLTLVLSLAFLGASLMVPNAYADKPSEPRLVNPFEISATEIDVKFKEPLDNGGFLIDYYNIHVESPLGTFFASENTC